MFTLTRSSPLLVAGVLLLSTLPVGASPSTPTQPTPPSKDKLVPAQPFKLLFRPPLGLQRPARTTGAGSRNGGLCPQDRKVASLTTPSANHVPLTALVPIDHIGWTLMERPTFWVYVPQTTAKHLLLSLETKEGVFHSQTTFTVPPQGGLVSLPLPPSAPPLTVGTTYRWAALLVCGDRPTPNDVGVDAWVFRGTPPPSPAPSPLKAAAWSAEQGLWYDLLTQLSAEGRSPSRPSSAPDPFLEVLTDQGLGAVAAQLSQP